jgi:DNA-binding MarR family transcriptional regulator
MGATWLLADFGLTAALLADGAPPEILTSGWAATGVLGLLASILAFVLRWLLFTHLPEKDKQFERLIEAKDAQIKAILARHDEQAVAADRECRENANRLVAALSDQHEKNRLAWKEQSEKDRAVSVQIAEKDRALFAQAIQEQQRANAHIRRSQQQTIEFLKWIVKRQGGPAADATAEADDDDDCPDR